MTTLVAYSNYRTESGITVSEIGKHIRQREIGGKWAFFLTNPDLSELLASAPGENFVILRLCCAAHTLWFRREAGVPTSRNGADRTFRPVEPVSQDGSV